MAAITAPTINDSARPKDLDACRLLQIPIATNAATLSTWDSGIKGIYWCAWQGDGATDFCIPSWTSSGYISLTTDAASAHTGLLYVWTKG